MSRCASVFLGAPRRSGVFVQLLGLSPKFFLRLPELLLLLQKCPLLAAAALVEALRQPGKDGGIMVGT